MNIEKLRQYIEREKLDAFYITKPVNVRYISGYTGEDSFLLITKKEKYFITDTRYTEQASYECPDFKIIDYRKTKERLVSACIKKISESEKIRNVGFEEDFLTFATWRNIQEVVGVELVPKLNVIEEMRTIKTKEEITYLRAACEISSRAFERVLKDIRVGITEKEVAAKLAYYMVKEGADTKPYGGIVVSGEKTSLLHGIPDNKSIEYGDYLLMDFGCQFKGYLSDMTRTIVVGRASEEQRIVYELCRKMTEDVELILKPGVTGKECYKASTKAILGTPYYDYHYQGIGHGIGLFVHEKPFIGVNHDDIIEENQVMTVEPGIYIPRWGGVRVEDQLLITADGCENLVNATHELIEL